MTKMNLDNLETEARKLVKLLEAREPGLMTWQEAFDRALHAIVYESGYLDFTTGTDNTTVGLRAAHGESDECTCVDLAHGLGGTSTDGCKVHG
jgi:hypothetical protein